ncbi:MAG: reductive dehalogenase [Motiliproteus sp.]
MKLFSYRNRPVHMGPYPAEKLGRTEEQPALSHLPPMQPLQMVPDQDPYSIGRAINDYLCVLDAVREGQKMPVVAEIPDDLTERARHLKAAGHFLDSSLMGCCELQAEHQLQQPFRNPRLQELLDEQKSSNKIHLQFNATMALQRMRASIIADSAPIDHHTHALVIAVEFPRDARDDEPGAQWLPGMQPQRAALRAAETAAVLSQYLRQLGFEARAHSATSADVDLNRLAVSAGIALADDDGKISNPYLGRRFGLAAITTTLAFQVDQPLAPQNLTDKVRSKGPAWWVGHGSTKNAFNAVAFKRRDFKDSHFPTEKDKHVDTPTSLIDGDRIPRIPKRSNFFTRAAFGDLGPGPQDASKDGYFVGKYPLGAACASVLQAYMLLQRSTNLAARAPGYDNPVSNAEIIKATLHYLGTDQVGICEAPDWVWYSHGEDGTEIKPAHKYAITTLIDQGHESQEGGSGDDWLSCTQSMRAYMRASLVGGVVAQHLRNLGYSATTHTAADGDVIQPPLALLSGLGEISRIGDVVLNPHMGPRLKTGVVTTDFPMEVDTPIDFGLQKFCDRCNKCARECPSGAITAGPKVMYNGYEIWKSDQEKCTRYRLTNDAGSMCGRCMKTCPWNLEGIFKEAPFRWLATRLPSTAKWLCKVDDWMGNGGINPVKKWWWDIRTDKQGVTLIATDTNRRGLNTQLVLKAEDQTLACYPADLAPPPYPAPYPVDREEGIEAYRELISPTEYRKKLACGETDSLVPQYQFPEGPAPVFAAKVVRRKVSSADEKVVIFELTSQDGSVLPPFEAGAHIDITVAPPFIRQYSLAGDPADASRYLVGILREDEGRGGSLRIHQQLQEGRPVLVSRPRNHFQLVHEAKRSLLLAGGIGVTPLIAMAHQLHSEGREFSFYYKSKTRAQAGFIEELESYAWADRVQFHFSDENRLMVDDVLNDYQPGDHLYTCGPAAFMDAVFESGQQQGWSEDSLHREYFSAPDTGDYENHAFTLFLQRSGIEIQVPEDKSAAVALQEAGQAVDIKCGDGLCGVCSTDYVEGDIEHRDYVLSKSEREQRLILCCSRASKPNGRVVLDR